MNVPLCIAMAIKCSEILVQSVIEFLSFASLLMSSTYVIWYLLISAVPEFRM